VTGQDPQSPALVATQLLQALGLQPQAPAA